MPQHLWQLSLGGIVLCYMVIVAQEYFTSARRVHEDNITVSSSFNGIGSSIQLPKTTSKTLKDRGKLVSELVTAEELYEAYKSIRDEYDEKAFQCDTENNINNGGVSVASCDDGWKILKQTEDGVEVAMLQHPSDPACPYVRMSAVMPGTLTDVWNFLALENWDTSMPKMDPFYEGLDIVKRYNHQDGSNSRGKHKKNKSHIEIVLARKKTSRLLTFGKRDFTFVSVSDVPREDGVWVSGTVSVVTKRLPRVKGYTRAFQDSVAFYEALPASNNNNHLSPRTKLTIVCRIDLNDSTDDGDSGGVPMWIYVKTIGSTGVLSIKNMRRELQRVLDERMSITTHDNSRSSLNTNNNNYVKKWNPLAFLPWYNTRIRNQPSS